MTLIDKTGPDYVGIISSICVHIIEKDGHFKPGSATTRTFLSL